MAAVQRLIGNRATTRLVELQRATGTAGAGAGRASEAPAARPRGPLPVQRAFFGSTADADYLAEVRRRPPRGTRQERLAHHYGELLGPKGGSAKERELDDQGDVRLNPLWYRLQDFPPKLLLERKGALWHYSVGENREISLGSEAPAGIVQDDEWSALLDGMRRTNPDLTAEQLRQQLDDQGHPTIAAGFDRTGRTTVRPARVSGELQWNEEAGRFEVSDKSGRYMSAKVRPGVEPDQAMRWLTNVARRMTEHFGVPVHPVVVKSG